MANPGPRVYNPRRDAVVTGPGPVPRGYDDRAPRIGSRSDEEGVDP